MSDYIVYVMTDDRNRIIAVNSSAFLSDPSGWTEIDRGIGDKYHHAQANYFQLPMKDGKGSGRRSCRKGRELQGHCLCQ